jgi:hypothetical protein
MFKKIARHKAISLLSLASFAFALGGSLWAYFALRSVANAPLILHFDDLAGVTAVGGLGEVVFVGFLGVAVVVMNFFIALELDERDRFLGKCAAAVTFIFAILLFLAFVAIINVN